MQFKGGWGLKWAQARGIDQTLVGFEHGYWLG